MSTTVTTTTTIVKSNKSCDKVATTSVGHQIATEKTLFSRLKPLLGLGLLILTSTIFSVSNVVVKEAENVDSFSVAFYRSAFMVLFTLPVVIDRNAVVLSTDIGPWLLLRGVFGTGALMSHLYGIKNMPIADAIMIVATAPAYAAIFARIFLKEKLTLLNVVNLALALTGVALIIRPTFIFGSSTSSSLPLSSYPNYYWSAASAALSAMLQGAVFVLLRKLKDADVSTVMLAFGVIAVALTASAPPAVGLPVVSLPACCLDRWLMVLVGTLSLLGQKGLTTSSKLESAAVVSLVTKTFDVVLALAFQTFWFKETPGLYSIIGAVLILTVIVSSGLKKLVDELPADHDIKTKYLTKCYAQSQNDNDKEEHL